MNETVDGKKKTFNFIFTPEALTLALITSIDPVTQVLAKHKVLARNGSVFMSGECHTEDIIDGSLGSDQSDLSHLILYFNERSGTYLRRKLTRTALPLR
jgi:hypothetical protein